jgi:hypothetical protein
MPTTIKQTLTGPQFASITDFTQLFLRFKATLGGNTGQATGTGATAAVGAAVSGGADPISIFGANLAAWYKADAGVYTDAGTTLATNTQTVQQWNDQSGHGNHLTQATSGLRPQFLSAGLNGLPAVQFTASVGTVLQNANQTVPSTTNVMSVFGVGQMGTATQTYGRGIAFTTNASFAATTDYSVADSAIYWLRDGSSTNNFELWAAGSGAIGAQTIVPGTNYRFGAVIDGVGNTAHTYVNNVVDVAGSAAPPVTWGTAGAFMIGTGFGGGSGYSWDGPISEIVVVKAVVSSSDRAALDSYFQTKWWGAPANIGAAAGNGASAVVGLATAAATAAAAGTGASAVLGAATAVATAAATGTGASSVVGSTATTYDSATTAWAAQVVTNGGTVSTTQKGYVDTLITGLKSDGVWTKLDRLWLFAAENVQQALTDIVADVSATNVNSATFTANRGYTGNGSNMYINSNFNPTTATSPKYVQNSACMFGWSNTSGTESHAFYGDDGFDFVNSLGITGANLSWQINSAYTRQSTALGATGLYLMNRTGSLVSVVDVNGTQYDTQTTVSSAAVSNSHLTILRAGGDYSTKQASCLGFGGGLTTGDRTNVNSRLRTYMTSVGVP